MAILSWNRISRKPRSVHSPAEKVSPKDQMKSRCFLLKIQCMFKWQEILNVFDIKIYQLFQYQKNIPFLLWKHTLRNSFVRQLHAGNKFWSTCHLSKQYETGVVHFQLAIVMCTCPRTNVKMRHNPSVLCSKQPAFECYHLSLTAFLTDSLSLDLHIKCFILTGRVFKSWFTSPGFILTSTLL